VADQRLAGDFADGAVFVFGALSHSVESASESWIAILRYERP
jgi:hypothetical protein